MHVNRCCPHDSSSGLVLLSLLAVLQMSVNFLVSLLKKNWQNVRSLHCKTTMVSLASPLGCYFNHMQLAWLPASWGRLSPLLPVLQGKPQRLY